MESAIYGYARVSTREQNLDRQLAAFREFGIMTQNIFCDRASGKDFDRPAWIKLMDAIANGDVLVIKSIDRLGRNYDEIICMWKHLHVEIGVDIVVLDMPLLDTRRNQNGLTGELISDIVLQLLSYVAQIERENIHARQAEGIVAAKARGVSFGRPRKKPPRDWTRVKQEYLCGNLTSAEACKAVNVSRGTFFKWLKTS